MVNPSTLYPIPYPTAATYPKPAKELVFLKHFVHNPNIIVGDYTYYDDPHSPEKFEYNNVRGGYFSKLTIGKFCQIAMDTTFILSDMNHHMDGFSTYPFFLFDPWKQYEEVVIKGDTIVGNDVWFGTNAVIMPGVKIGHGAIIGAYAVVTKDVAPYTIVAGNPAKLIRKRFSNEIVADLLTIQWWDWEYDKITKNIRSIVGADIAQLKSA